MANVTRIKAKDDGPSKKKETSKSDEPEKVTRKVSVSAKGSKNKKAAKAERKAARKLEKAEKKAAKSKDERDIKTFFVLFRPFIAFWRYIRDSFREMRQVVWPNRKQTWKLVISIIIYVIVIAGFIMLLDVLFNYLFNLVFGGNN